MAGWIYRCSTVTAAFAAAFAATSLNQLRGS